MLSNESQRCHFLTFDTDKIDQARSVYIVAASLNAILILPTTLLNILLIISLYRSSEIRKPSTKLLFSLAMSDVLVGLVMGPTFLVKKLAEFNHDFGLYCKSGAVAYVGVIYAKAIVLQGGSSGNDDSPCYSSGVLHQMLPYIEKSETRD